LASDHGQLTPAPTARVEVHPRAGPDLSIGFIETSSFIGYHYPPITQISLLSPPYLPSTVRSSRSINASTPYRRGISEVTPRPEREEEDRQTQSTQKPNLAGGKETQGADAQAEAEARPTRRSQR